MNGKNDCVECDQYLNPCPMACGFNLPAKPICDADCFGSIPLPCAVPGISDVNCFGLAKPVADGDYGIPLPKPAGQDCFNIPLPKAVGDCDFGIPLPKPAG